MRTVILFSAYLIADRIKEVELSKDDANFIGTVFVIMLFADILEFIQLLKSKK